MTDQESGIKYWCDRDTSSHKTPQVYTPLLPGTYPHHKRMHFLSQLSDRVPLRNGFHSFRAQTD